MQCRKNVPSPGKLTLSVAESKNMKMSMSNQYNPKNMPKKIIEALVLPKVINCNPQSLYNKKDEFLTFLEINDIQLAHISESWDREKWPISDLLKDLERKNFTIISNVHQRKGRGGRPILIVKNDNFEIQNLTQTVVKIPWGAEIVWCCLTPKNANNDSKIQKIICASIYSKPNSRFKSVLLDHISDTFNFLSTKYQKGLHWILAGDINEMKLDSILSLHPTMKQVVTKRTRLRSKPPGILDPIITTLSNYYQMPEVLPPLKADNGKSESDHLIVMMSPLNMINNKPARTTRHIFIRRMPESKMSVLEEEFKICDWSRLFEAVSAHEKAEILQDSILEILDKVVPIKKVTFSSEDSDFFTPELKQLDRQRKRIYFKQGRSSKFKIANKKFKLKMKNAKYSYYDRMIKDLKYSNPRQWYSKMKRIMSNNNDFSSDINIEEICHLSDEEQAEALASYFSSVSQEYKPLSKSDVKLPQITENPSNYFSSAFVLPYMERIKTNKANTQGDIPSKIIKRFSKFFVDPFTELLNTMIVRGEYPCIWKTEIQTPIPKSFPVQEISQMRNISVLLNFDKICQSIFGELMIKDMKPQIDQSQFGNQKNTSIQHYLMKMLNEILVSTDDGENAVLACFVDWKEAFPRQCHKLGMEAFIKMGVRPVLLPCLLNFFQDRKMKLKWKGVLSNEKQLPGSGPMGATLGLLEYIAQSNNNTEGLKVNEKFKWVDDLSTLEKIKLQNAALQSYNVRLHVPNDIPVDNGFIQPESLKSQDTLNNISAWTAKQKMRLNHKKSNIMIFNFSRKNKFTTRLKMNDKILPVVKKTKILGTILTDDLKWDENSKDIIKRANFKLQMLRKATKFTNNKDDLKEIYISYIRSILEQSAVIWTGNLTEENKSDLERVQKNVLRVIFGDEYEHYNDSLEKLGICTLSERREKLTKKFAISCIENERTKNLFPLKKNLHQMSKRKSEKFKVNKANTKRYMKSAVPSMQRLLNEMDI